MMIEYWHPVTSDKGMINAPVDELACELVAWHESINHLYLRQTIVSSLEAAFEALPPLSAEKRRRLFVATLSGWTACFQSGIQGSDPFPTMSVLAERLAVLAMRICSTAAEAVWPATIWEVYAPVNLGGEPPLQCRRSICAANDGGRWVFEQSGQPFSFEKLESYERPRKRDRFTPDLLQKYLAEFGLTPFSDDFYDVSPDKPAILLECTSRWENGPPEF